MHGHSMGECSKLPPAVMEAKQSHHHLYSREKRSQHNSSNNRGYMGFWTAHQDHEGNHNGRNLLVHLWSHFELSALQFTNMKKLLQLLSWRCLSNKMLVYNYVYFKAFTVKSIRENYTNIPEVSWNYTTTLCLYLLLH